jgi:hypothetical protein
MKKNLLLTIGLAVLVSLSLLNAQTSSATFKVNMKYAALSGLFNPATDFVDVAGTFNGWDGTNHHLTAGTDSVYSITVDNLKDTIYEFKFRINGSWDDATCEFPKGGPNRKITVQNGIEAYGIYNNYRPGWVPVSVSVNMSIWQQLGKFDPKTQVVDITGDFLDWSHFVELFDNNDLLYKGTVLAESGKDMQFKFRINHSWDDATCEFPGGGANRVYTVLDTTGGVTNVAGPYFYNNDSVINVVKYVNSNVELSVFPNPVASVLYIQSSNTIQRVIVSDLSGRQIINRIVNANNMGLSVNELVKGSYLVRIMFNDGTQNIQKVLKY